MITLTILATAFVVIVAIVLALGAGFIAIFGDLIIAALVIGAIIKFVHWLRHRNKEEKEETTK